MAKARLEYDRFPVHRPIKLYSHRIESDTPRQTWALWKSTQANENAEYFADTWYGLELNLFPHPRGVHHSRVKVELNWYKIISQSTVQYGFPTHFDYQDFKFSD